MVSEHGAVVRIERTTLERDGVVVVRGVVPRELALDVAAASDRTIARLADDIDRPVETYMRSVSVWRCRSAAVGGVQEVQAPVAELVSALLGQAVTSTKTSVIRKSRHSATGTPWHQDAPYARRTPYVVSTWLALDDAGEGDAMLRFLPGTHRQAPAPLVDYWRPDFVDRAPDTSAREVVFPVAAGDVLVFDPFVWHASLPCKSGRRRLAVSARWVTPDCAWTVPIPSPVDVEFGMRNAGSVTEDVLRAAYKRFVGPAPTEKTDLLAAWRARLLVEAPAGVEVVRAIDALVRLGTLDVAHHLHDAGDQEGHVYRDIWRSLVGPLRLLDVARRA